MRKSIFTETKTEKEIVASAMQRAKKDNRNRYVVVDFGDRRLGADGLKTFVELLKDEHTITMYRIALFDNIPEEEELFRQIHVYIERNRIEYKNRCEAQEVSSMLSM